RELDGAREVAARALGRIARSPLAHHLVADEERVDRTALVALVELERAIDERLHGGKLGDGLGFALGQADGSGPRGTGPVEKSRLGARDRCKGLPRLDAQL